METCPGCDKQIPDDSLTCPHCKYDLIDDKPAPIEEEVIETPKKASVTTSSTGGRGKKQCPQCKQYVGARIGVCACGHDFASAPAAPKAEKTAPAGPAPKGGHVGGVGRMAISIPAGKCPVKYEEGDDLWSWMCQVWQSGYHRNPPVDYAASALR